MPAFRSQPLGPIARTELRRGIMASLKTRLDGLYVDWSDGEWQYGAKVEPAILRGSIEGVQAVVSQASASWPEATSLP